jgi:hypothetical protein
MAQSGGPHEARSTREIIDLLRQCRRDANKRTTPSPYAEIRRHAYERSINNHNLMDELQAELDFRERAKAERQERDEQREIARAAREQAREERLAKEQAEREKAREARLAREAVEVAARPPESPAASVMHPVDSALKAYFQRTKIPEFPTITTEHVELAWTHNRRYYIAIYAASALKVWILVETGTPGATPINGNEYLPADNISLIHQAHVAESKAPKRR